MTISTTSSRSPPISTSSTSGSASSRSCRSRASVEQRPLRHGSGQGDHQHREQREVDLLDDGLVGLVGQLGLGAVDLLAHLDQGEVDVDAGLELKQHRGVALARGRAHLLQALEHLQLALHRPHQQPLGVLGADALVAQGHVDDRQLDVGVGLLGDLVGDHRTPQDDQQQADHDHAAALEAGGDQPVHAGTFAVAATAAGSSGTISTPTFSPTATKPWPVVITCSRSGRPASQTASVSALAILAGIEPDGPVRIDRLDADRAVVGQDQDRRRDAMRRDLRLADQDAGAHAGGQAAVGVGHLELDAEGPGVRVRPRRDVADAAQHGLPVGQHGGPGLAHREAGRRSSPARRPRPGRDPAR